MKGYSFETKEYSSETLHLPFVPATYVIHLKGNGRYDSVIEQLNKYPLTSKVYILMNDGYKKADKGPFVQSAAEDLIHAYTQIFKDALGKGYSKVLILEDDFFFVEDSFDENMQRDLHQFLEEMDWMKKEYMFLLGCIPYFMTPVSHNAYRCYLSTGTHAAIYSKKVMERLVGEYGEYSDFDVHTNYHYPRYTYFRPIAYQLFPETENKKAWGGNNPLLVLGALLIKSLFRWFRLEEDIEPGYSFFYRVSKYTMIGILLVGLLLPASFWWREGGG